MRGLTLLRSLAINNLVVAGDGSAYLLTPDPKEVWQSAAVGTDTIDIDLGAASQIDSVFVGFTNAAATATWTIDRTTSIAGANPVRILEETAIRVPGAIGSRQQALALLAAPVTTRYLRIRLIQTGAAAMQAGVVMVGKRIEQPYEFKAGRRPIDLSERVDLAGGGFGFGRSAIKSSLRFTIAGIDDAQLATLWAMIKATGNQYPVLFVEGGDDPIGAEQVHYGVFERFEAYEREDPGDTRWALSMQDWV